MARREQSRTVLTAVLVVGLSIVLAFVTTSEYVRQLGFDYLERGPQLERYRDVLDGSAGNPWQYRVLAPFLIQATVGALDALGIRSSMAAVFVAFRMTQDLLILVAAYLVYRKLDLSQPSALLGVGILGWSMAASSFDSDLQFSTFFDVLFYLVAGLLVLHRKPWLVVPVTALAALNRETSGLIPFLVLLAPPFEDHRSPFRRQLAPFAASFGAFVVVFVFLRLIYPDQDLVLPYGHRPGFDMLAYNLFRLITWRQLIATLSIVPVVALLRYSAWRREIRAFFWAVVPVWFAVHAFAAVMAESRLFLVPQALIFIPGALCAVNAARSRGPRDHSPEKTAWA